MLFTARSAATFINEVYGVPGGVNARYVTAAIHEGELIARMRVERPRKKGMYKIHPAELRDWCRKEFPRATPVLDALLARAEWRTVQRYTPRAPEQVARGPEVSPCDVEQAAAEAPHTANERGIEQHLRD
jgi:hypothetical protein